VFISSILLEGQVVICNNLLHFFGWCRVEGLEGIPLELEDCQEQETDSPVQYLRRQDLRKSQPLGVGDHWPSLCS